jgi:hypothetical protein
MSEDPTLAQLEVVDALIDTLGSLTLGGLLHHHPMFKESLIIEFWLRDRDSVANLIRSLEDAPLD